MLAVFDSETRGLWGSIFRMGYYDEVRGYKTFYTAEEFVSYLMEVEKTLPDVTITVRKKQLKVKDTLYVYAFNLEFDMSKILQELTKKKISLDIDFDKSLLINSNFHTVKIAGKNIVFCDLYPIVKTSLKDAAKSFGLNYQKMDLEELDLEKYFMEVKPDDKELLKYLEIDVLCTYELLQKVVELSELKEADFVKCPTVASLAMKIFKLRMPDDFATITNCDLSKDQEEFVRKSYYGGRTEVYKNLGENLYHYDVNSLYPHAMQSNFYPTGKASMTYELGSTTKKGDLVTIEFMEEVRQMYKDLGFLYIAECEVESPPNLNIPILPFRLEKKLLFPTGIFSGVWCSPEIEYAEKMGVRITKINRMIVWKEKEKVFNKFVTTFRTLKETSQGGKRIFAKYIQNSLYGKFGMSRERRVYEIYTDKKRETLDAKEIPNAKVQSYYGGIDLLTYNKTVYADYIRPHYASFITSYSRIILCQAMHEVEMLKGDVYYCDTDSLVTSMRLPPTIVDDNIYGKWKLERIAEKGIYLLPKLYAEKTPTYDLLKSKGIVRKYMNSIEFDDYYKFYQYMQRGERLTLYSKKDGYCNRQKIITSMLVNADFDKKVLLTKSLRFDLPLQKRNFDHAKNTSKPLILNLPMD